MGCNKTSRQTNRGFILMEMMVYVAVFSIAVVLFSRVFVTTSRVSAYNTQIVERMDAVREVQRDFLKTCRAATAIVPGIGEHRTDEHTLVLQLHGTGQTPRYAVLGGFGDSNRLALLALVQEDDVLHAEKFKTWRLPVTDIRFETDDRAQSVTLALTTQPHNPQRPDTGRAHRFVATLRAGTTEARHGK